MCGFGQQIKNNSMINVSLKLLCPQLVAWRSEQMSTRDYMLLYFFSIYHSLLSKNFYKRFFGVIEQKTSSKVSHFYYQKDRRFQICLDILLQGCTNDGVHGADRRQSASLARAAPAAAADPAVQRLPREREYLHNFISQLFYLTTYQFDFDFVFF